MNPTTVARLNAINRAFYQTTAAAFDQTRSQPWPGWEKLSGYLTVPLTVLDVGCGNGRFGVFLTEQLQAVMYHGIDSNPTLLDRARNALPTATFETRDIVEVPLTTGTYDLVVLFGVMHHIPGAQQRLNFMQQLADRVKPGGLLAFACWRFYEFERFRQRIVPWPADLVVEEHDYLLDWRRGATALRYCHYVDDAEHAALIQASGLRPVATYRADGASGTMNQYSILQAATPNA